MKTTPLLLTVSLLLNATLLVFLALPSDNPLRHSSPASAISHSPSSPPAAVTDGKTGATTEPSPEQLSAALKFGNHLVLRDQLRALGMPESTVQAMIRASLWQPYLERQRAMLAAKTSDAGPYWRSPLQAANRSYTAEERAELRTLASQLREVTVALLGVEGLDVRGTLSSRYSFLAPESAAKLADLDLDYGEMRQEITQESERFKVASDAGKLKYLERERRKDIEAALSPAELSEYDLRYSPAAIALRSRLKQVDLSEAEYRNLFDLQKNFLDTRTASPNSKASAADTAQVTRDMQALLGDERYAIFRRANDPDYRQLEAAGDRFNIPVATLNNVYALRDGASAETRRIAADSSSRPPRKNKPSSSSQARYAEK
ncbi:MAG: hypothetical protein QM760_05910 [Nibricoccus sp.]